MEHANPRKRPASSSSPPWRRSQKVLGPLTQKGGRVGDDQEIKLKKEQESFAREQTKRNQIQEAEQMREWVSKEDEFVLKQAKKKAQIRVREGRAKSIDWLAVILSVIDPTKDLLEDESADSELDIMDPNAIVEDLSEKELHDLEKDIDSYEILESNRSNQVYWNVRQYMAVKIICQDRRRRLALSESSGRIINAVSVDVDRLLGPKTIDQLRKLEEQISEKLQSNEPIDVEYWEQLLSNIAVYKAKAELKKFYKSVVDSRLQVLRGQQIEEAELMKAKLSLLLVNLGTKNNTIFTAKAPEHRDEAPLIPILHLKVFDPDPLLKVRVEDKGLDIVGESEFLDKITLERRRTIKMGYVPHRQRKQEKSTLAVVPKILDPDAVPTASRFATTIHEDFSSATSALYEREVARGVQEDEEIFTGEEEVLTLSKPQWAGKYRPRKPRYFNRVQMGYEWNKYNQTHYDHDNPPPKVVQGYKFNVFYPDLIDKVKAPTYRIERENGRKRGQSFAPAGEEDTCLIRFISGPPYEDLAFRIVDKEWDYSAKRERGFRSSFDKVSSDYRFTWLRHLTTTFPIQKGLLQKVKGPQMAVVLSHLSIHVNDKTLVDEWAFRMSRLAAAAFVRQLYTRTKRQAKIILLFSFIEGVRDMESIGRFQSYTSM
ncbi:hypothetical protein MMC26_006158 [Xylographa opegraphella]|nr:hypothetical protein [Xylographa opegraphella]